MKLIVSLIVMVGVLFSSSSFENVKSNVPFVKLNTILKGSHKQSILNIGFYKNEKMFTVSEDGVLKIWDIAEQELLKSIFVGSGLKKVLLSKDGKKIYILEKTYFRIYNANSYKLENSIKLENNLDMQITSNNEVLIVSYRNLIKYNLKNGELLFSVESDGSWYKNITISKNQKYVAISSSRKKVKVYRVDSGEFISQLPTFSSIEKINFLDNKNISILNSTRSSSMIYVYNFKTSEKQMESKDYKRDYIKSMVILDKSYLLVNRNNNILKLIDRATFKELKQAKIDSSSVTFYGIQLSDDKSLLALGFKNGNIKLYDSRNFLNVTTAPLKKVSKAQLQLQVKEPVKVIYKDRVIEKEKIVYRDKIVVKEVEKKVENQAPTLILEASTKAGVIPLKVDFTILASDDKGISSYYINLAGKESMKRGTPPTTISKTFQTAGKYKVFVAVKDAEGKMATKSIIITPREETFSDYKKRFQ